MSKITFRADDDLVAAVESLDASKSEVMREALREYLEEDVAIESESIDELVDARIEEVLGDYLRRERSAQDVNVNLRVESSGSGEVVDADVEESAERAEDASVSDGGSGESESVTCRQCGESLDAAHEFCPNCGEQAGRPALCECGVELGSDWSFCPHCGRRTPSADVLER
ncbi:double zinc ribbon domain-containing protein [Halocalculus aciditolerans]|uniref:CopG family transcriptional regulator n=1 Tax=Halocalculus aciditolerans TaxID=1383812 RepID=A0A830FD87_9EURY|nr:zinc ribbon domain-containing protein [Halocalculus aciditolerans]GGL63687.1 hypothetical protein GCM10009039_22000 [Halocalculus aciditolerans]